MELILLSGIGALVLLIASYFEEILTPPSPALHPRPRIGNVCIAIKLSAATLAPDDRAA